MDDRNAAMMGELLIDFRETYGRSRTEQAAILSDLAGHSVTTAQVSHWENEHTLLSPFEQKIYAQSFGLPVEPVSRAVDNSRIRIRMLRNRFSSARRKVGLSQEAMAHELRVELSTVGRWERGQSKPQAWILGRIAKVLKIPMDELVDIFDNTSKPSTPPERTAEDSFVSVVMKETIAASDNKADDKVVTEEADSVPQVARRTVIRSEIAAGAALGFGGVASLRSVDPSIVPHLLTLRSALVSSDSLLGPGRLIASAREQATNIVELIGRSKGNVRIQLFEVGALFAEFCGWLADDIGDIEAGRSWSNRALEWAEASRNDNLAAFVLMRTSQQAQLVNETSIVAPLAIAAQRRNRDGEVSVRVQAAAAQQAAIGYALEREVDKALSSLDYALELVNDTHDLADDPFELAGYCTPEYLNAQRGYVLAALGEYDRALTAYSEALRSWPSEYRRERGLHLARQTRIRE